MVRVCGLRREEEADTLHMSPFLFRLHLLLLLNYLFLKHLPAFIRTLPLPIIPLALLFIGALAFSPRSSDTPMQTIIFGFLGAYTYSYVVVFYHVIAHGRSPVSHVSPDPPLSPPYHPSSVRGLVPFSYTPFPQASIPQRYK